MAPPTLPTEAKRRRGTLRTDRTPAAMVLVDRAPLDVPPPEHLGEVGRAEWDHALRTCPWIASSDLTALKFLCEAVERREQLRQVMAEGNNSLMLETSTGYAYANPILAAMDKCEERISKWMSQLGMTPSDRSRLGVAEVKAASTLDKLAARRHERAGGRRESEPPSLPPPSERGTGPRSSSSLTATAGSRRTLSQDRPETPSTPESGSDD